MEAVKLMDRTDTKFSFHANRLPELLNHLKKITNSYTSSKPV
jgi:hypothetical protein